MDFLPRKETEELKELLPEKFGEKAGQILLNLFEIYARQSVVQLMLEISKIGESAMSSRQFEEDMLVFTGQVKNSVQDSVNRIKDSQQQRKEL